MKIGNAAQLDLFASSNRFLLGDCSSLEFTPVFWVAGGAPGASYSAEFRLLDLGTNGAVLSQSGTFNFDFAAPVPLPPAAWLLASALAAIGVSRRRAAAT